jgi:hypothetical protein
MSPRILVPIALCAGLAGPAQAVEETRPEAHAAFEDGLARCTRLYGYAPSTAQSLGPHELGKGELDWRDCAYHVVRKTLVPGSRVPMVYEQAIREDKAMTAAIQRRELTRAERRRKLDDLFDSLRATEVLNTPTSKPGKTGGDRLSPQEIETFSQMFLPDRFGH